LGACPIPVQNVEVAEIFERVADLLEIQGANPFRVRAYRTAAQSVRALPHALHELVEEGEDLSKLAGIGKDLAGKIAEIVETGSLSLLEELGRETPPELAQLLALPGLGPKRARALHEELGIKTLEELVAAAREGRVRKLPGFGAKTEQTLLAAVERRAGEGRRALWVEAEPVARDLVAYLEDLKGVKQVEVAGSFRRRRETVGDLDILVTCTQGTKVSDRFVAYEDVAKVLAHGKTRSTVVLRSGLQVDLRVVPQVSYGAALAYFTGSKAHNIAIRKLGVRKKLKINEYGVFRGDKRQAGRTEAEVYRKVGLPYIEPELREDRGEIEAARRGRLPRLIELDDIRGDLHAHTKATDGHASIEEMGEAARKLGYAYLAISDHTQAARVAGGLDTKSMRRHLGRIEKANAKLRRIRLLKSAEVDILENGSLDLPKAILRELDLVVCAVHSAFGLSRKRQTERILRAMDDVHFHVLAHPTGRLLGRREPYDVDLERLIEAAAERGCFLELNAQPERMDLPDAWCKAAKEAGVKLAISTDAHSTDQLDAMRLGVGYARRGWLEAEDVLNTRDWPELEKLLRRRA
jgi:DNA polymerase (family 10)